MNPFLHFESMPHRTEAVQAGEYREHIWKIHFPLLNEPQIVNQGYGFKKATSDIPPGKWKVEAGTG